VIHAAGAIGSLFRIERRWRVGGGTGINNAAVVRGNQAVIDQTETLANRRKALQDDTEARCGRQGS